MTWTNKTIGDWADVIGGGTPSTRATEFWGGDIPWFTPGEIPESGAGIVRNSNRLITKAGLARSAAKMLPVGSVLVTSRASIGNCAIAGVPMATNQGFTSLVPKDSRSSLFLYYWVQQNRHQFLSRSAGSTFLEISVSKVRDIEISSPGLPEQAAIGEAIADADHLITTLERLIAKKQAIKQGMMQQLLTGRTRLPGFGGPWRTATIGELAHLKSGRPKSRSTSGNFWVIDMGSVTRDGRLKASRQTSDGSDFLRSGDLVMPKDDIGGGHIIGRTAIIPESDKYVLADHVYAITQTKVDPRFLNYAINSHDVNRSLRSKASGSAQLGLAKRSVLEQIIYYPESRDEQARIGAMIADAEAQIAAIYRSLEKVRKIKLGMMQQLLTGRTRFLVDA